MERFLKYLCNFFFEKKGFLKKKEHFFFKIGKRVNFAVERVSNRFFNVFFFT